MAPVFPIRLLWLMSLCLHLSSLLNLSAATVINWINYHLEDHSRTVNDLTQVR